MNISLSRNVKLHCYDILMDMGIKTDKRPDIVAVTKRAQELGGSITPEIICKDLINRPKAISAGRNILQRCQDLDLFDDRGRLTEEGQRTAEEETVFMPETGTYRIWFSEMCNFSFRTIIDVYSSHSAPRFQKVHFLIGFTQ